MQALATRASGATVRTAPASRLRPRRSTPLPSPALPLRQRKPAARAPRRAVATQAALVPSTVKIILDGAGAFLVLYLSLSWASLRRTRLQVEKIQADRAEKDEERKARLERLNGKPPADDA